MNKKGQVLLIKASSLKSADKEYWGFPKGNVKVGESMKEAALREVKEETGVEAEIIDKAGDSKYVYTRDGEKVFKVVAIYLMEYKSGNTKEHDWEVSEASWFVPKEALKKLSFSQDKNLLKKALEI